MRLYAVVGHQEGHKAKLHMTSRGATSGAAVPDASRPLLPRRIVHPARPPLASPPSPHPQLPPVTRASPPRPTALQNLPNGLATSHRRRDKAAGPRLDTTALAAVRPLVDGPRHAPTGGQSPPCSHWQTPAPPLHTLRTTLTTLGGTRTPPAPPRRAPPPTPCRPLPTTSGPAAGYPRRDAPHPDPTDLPSPAPPPRAQRRRGGGEGGSPTPHGPLGRVSTRAAIARQRGKGWAGGVVGRLHAAAAAVGPTTPIYPWGPPPPPTSRSAPPAPARCLPH